MAFTSKLGTDDAVLALGMSARFLPDNSVTESVASAMSLGHTLQFTIDPLVVQPVSMSDVASFVLVPTPPRVPLIIDDGLVQQNPGTIDSGIEFTRFLVLDHTTTIEDRVIVCEAVVTVTLIAAVTFARRRLEIKNVFAGTVTINTNGSEMIDAVSSTTLDQWDSLTLFSTGTGWIVL